MKQFNPPPRLIDLNLVLKYDCEQVPFLNPKTEKFCINQERAKLLNNDCSYIQSIDLETKIQQVLTEIKTKNWTPENPIKYNLNF